MELEGFENIQLELKYCERCGGLWIRLAGSQQLYCAGCALEMAQLAPAKRKCTKPRLPFASDAPMAQAKRGRA